MTSQRAAEPEPGAPATASPARSASAVAPSALGAPAATGGRAGPANQHPPESFGGELDQAVRKERHIALRMLIALAIVALVVGARLLFFG